MTASPEPDRDHLDAGHVSHLPLGSVIASAAIVSPEAIPGSSSACCPGVAPFMIALAESTTPVCEVRRAQQRCAHLFEHDAELDPREPLAAVLLGDVEALETELVRHLAPHRGVVALIGLHEPPNLRRRRLRLEETPDCVAELVLLGEGQIHHRCVRS